jgi:hypothetical protein
MTQAHRFLYDEVSRLPIEKIGKAISFIRFLEQEPEPELILAEDEESELHELLTSGDLTDATELLEKIKALPDA